MKARGILHFLLREDSMIKRKRGPISYRDGRVLIVEDDLLQRELLSQVVRTYGCEAIAAEEGAEALAMVRQDEPDVVLTDVVMPGMSGLELCRAIKDDISIAHIPVIIVTSLSEKQHMLEGIEAGADEFLTKPIDPQEVGLRIGNAISAKRLFEDLRKNYCRLKELEQARDSLTHMMVHDMRSILMGISGNAELLKMRTQDRLRPDEVRFLENILTNISSMVEMVGTVLDVSRMENGKMPINITRTDIRDVVNKAIDLLGVRHCNVAMKVELPDTPAYAECDPDVICRVLTNLIANALKFTRGLEYPEISIFVVHDKDTVRVSVSDNGPGIPAEEHRTIFQKYGQGVTAMDRGGRHSSGMGLYFCMLAIEAHGGTIGVESSPGQGATFHFDLKASGDMS